MQCLLNLRINVFFIELESIDKHSKTKKQRFLLYKIRYKHKISHLRQQIH